MEGVIGSLSNIPLVNYFPSMLLLERFDQGCMNGLKVRMAIHYIASL